MRGLAPVFRRPHRPRMGVPPLDRVRQPAHLARSVGVGRAGRLARVPTDAKALRPRALVLGAGRGCRHTDPPRGNDGAGRSSSTVRGGPFPALRRAHGQRPRPRRPGKGGVGGHQARVPALPYLAQPSRRAARLARARRGHAGERHRAPRGRTGSTSRSFRSPAHTASWLGFCWPPSRRSPSRRGRSRRRSSGG